MRKLLAVIDMQNDFVSGTLGTPEAEAIVPSVVKKVEAYLAEGQDVAFTRDTHLSDYLDTEEGKHLPVTHCVEGSRGWEIIDHLAKYNAPIFNKPTFGSVKLAEFASAQGYQAIELIGLCTDICVISNALLLKAYLPECMITVDSGCCAGVTPQSHQNALEAMKMCQIQILS